MVELASEMYYPLSESQKNIYELELVNGSTPINNICSTIKVQGRFDVARLSKALNLHLEKDSTLRTRITETNNVPYQYIKKYEPEQFPFLDFSHTGSEGIEHWVSAAAYVPMEIYNSPLYEFSIFRTDENGGGILVKLHHLIADGWTLVQFANSIADLYLKLLSDVETNETAIPAYCDHVQSEIEYRASELYREDGEYWGKVLDEYLDSHTVEHKRSGVLVSPVGKRASYVFSETINHLINKFCRLNNATPFSVFAMALSVYLSRMTGSKNVSLGVPVLNRTTFKDKKTGGMFVSTLPFFIRVELDKSLEEFNLSITESWYDLLRHQRYPFTDIFQAAKALNPNTTGLFDVVLSFQDSKIFHEKVASVAFSGKWIYSGYQTEKLVIHLNNMEDNFHYSVDYDYLTQVYTAEEIDAMHQHICRILEEALFYTSVPLRSLQLLTLEEKEKLLYLFNRTHHDQEYKTLNEGFLKAVASNPKKAALIYKGTRYSYEALKNKALVYAAEIAANGGGEVVAVSLPRVPELITAMLASSFAGAAWVIIQQDMPEERKKKILSDSGASVVITERKLFGFYSEQCEKVICIEDLNDSDEDQISFEPVKGSPDSLAYIVYTSGSTGTPKGVEIENKSLANFACGMKELYGHGGVLSLCNIGFDVFILESIVSLLNKKTVILSTNENDPEEIASLIKGFSVGFIALTPSRLQAYLKCKPFAKSLAGVENIVCGGEPISGELVQNIKKHTNASVYNQYGPSETAIGVSYKLVNNTSAITAGAPMQNCKLYVLDEYLNPLPTGAYGKLYISGACVGRGYRNSPEATEAAFVPNPFELNEIMYDSGDTAAWTRNGEIIIGERIGSQVKIRGLRVELQEIVGVLLTYPGIEQAAVRVIKNSSDYIAAYYTSESGIVEDDCAAFLATQLPSYMIPSCWIRVLEMPLTPNGKIDVRALPVPLLTAVERDPVSETEKSLLNIFKTVLNNDRLTVNSDFYQSGGDSLNAIILLNEIENKLGKKIKLTELFILKTPARIAARIDDIPYQPQPEEGLKSYSREQYPLTPIQTSMYLNTMLADKKTVYNMPGIFRLGAHADIAKLEKSFEILIEQEDILRTRFISNGETIVSVIDKDVVFHLENITAKSLQEAMACFVRPFDLAVSPLIRCAVWRDETDIYLLVDSHHIINDGLGTAILIDKLNKIYSTGVCVPPKYSYKDYACAMNELPKEKKQEQLEYWQRSLEGTDSSLLLPADFPRGETADFAGKSFEIAISDSVSEKIDSYCSSNGITPFSYFAGAFGILISKLTRSEDFLIGTPVSGRDSTETMNMLGAFLSTLPLRLRPLSGITIQEYLKNIHSTVSAVVQNKDVSIDEIINCCGAKRIKGANPLYNAFLTMRPVSSDFLIGGQAAEYIPVDSDISKLDFTVEIYKVNTAYRLRAEYRTAIFKDDTASLRMQCYCSIIENMLNAGKTTDFDDKLFMPSAENYRLFVKPMHYHAPFNDMCIDVMADGYGFLYPEQTAINDGGRKISYAEFIRRSDSIAIRLNALGVSQGRCVALMCKRSAELICAVFGIIKAGCPYLLLDSNLPQARIAEMLKASDAVLVLTDADAGAELAGFRTEALDFENTVKYSPHERSTASIAQLLFTSGSTGTPKGVQISHHALSNLISCLEAMYDKAEVESVVFSSSVLFDSFTVEVLVPLALGRTVIVVNEEEMLTPRLLGNIIAEAKNPLIFSTPSRITVALTDEVYARSLKNVRMIMLGGEVVSAVLAKSLLEACGGDIYNMYGPAETTAFVCAKLIKTVEKPTIGTPIPNIRLYVLDKSLNRVMPTASGELYISGDSLSDGYINDPKRTAAAFIDDPFVNGKKMYKTGDLVRLLPSGEFEFCGRADTQIKLNGQRIEAEEITGLVISNGLAADAAVTVLETPSGGVLTLFAVPKNASELDTRSIKNILSEKLPTYMVPSRIEAVPEIHYTNTGKIDIKALSSFQPEKKCEVRKTYSDALEELWCQCLNKDTIDENISFFDYGGSSLMAMELIIKYYPKGIDISLSDFYTNPTLKAQRALISGKKEEVHAAVSADSISEEKPPLMQESCPEAVSTPENKAEAKTIFVTGATGYLGAHIVKQLVEQGDCTVICLVRKSPDKLREALDYYFGAGWTDLNADRIKPIPGDITLPDLGITSIKHIDTVIHAAADVRHYMLPEEAERVNVNGTKNIISFAKANGASLSYISTLSVSGDRLMDRNAPPAVFTEKCRDIGQNKDENVYVSSKYKAEGLVLDAAAEGMRTKIFRVGRLVGRSTDGAFQRNTAANSFYKMIRGFIALGCIPEALAEMEMELTAVDLCAKAIVTLQDSDKNIFHVYNPNMTKAGDIVKCLSDDMKIVSNSVFNIKLFDKLSKQATHDLAVLMDSWGRIDKHGVQITTSCSLTEEELRARGFEWKKPDAALLLKNFI